MTEWAEFELAANGDTILPKNGDTIGPKRWRR